MPNKEKIIKDLKEKKVKITPQRIAVIDYLEKHLNHPTVEDIFEGIKKDFPTMSLATVYNTLHRLEDIGALHKLKLCDENKINYEYNMNPHCHFYCKKCGKIYDLDIVCPYLTELEMSGHVIDQHYGFMKGTCKECK